MRHGDVEHKTAAVKFLYDVLICSRRTGSEQEQFGVFHRARSNRRNKAAGRRRVFSMLPFLREAARLGCNRKAIFRSGPNSGDRCSCRSDVSQDQRKDAPAHKASNLRPGPAWLSRCSFEPSTVTSSMVSPGLAAAPPSEAADLESPDDGSRFA